MNFFQNVFKKSSFEFVHSDEKRLSNRLLSYSLMWLSLGLLIIALFSFAILTINPLREGYLKLIFISFNSRAASIATNIIMVLVSVGIMFYISSKSRRQNSSLGLLLTFYILFILIQAFWIPLAIYSFIIVRSITYTDELISDVLANVDYKTISYILISISAPAGIMAIIGALGWFQLINFSRFTVFIWAGLVAEFILILVSYFVTNSVVNTVYVVIVSLVTFAMIGYNFWLMKLESQILISNMKNEPEVKKIFLRVGLAYGMFLLVSYLRLVYILLNIFSRK